MYNEKLSAEYHGLIEAMSREPPPDDECAMLAAYDAYTEAYGLDRYPTPLKRKRRKRTASVAQTDSVFLLDKECEISCLV